MQPTDVGIGGHDNDGAEKVIELSTRPKNPGKRKKGLKIEDMREIFALSDVENLREVSMTGYFCTQTSIARLEAMRKVIDGQGFLLMDSDFQIEMKAEYKQLVQKLAKSA